MSSMTSSSAAPFSALQPQPCYTTYTLTSTTAPGCVFASREELAAHYQSDWHRYNLKRREAGLPVVSFVDFDARVQAARALQLEKQQQQKQQQHLKKDKKRRKENRKIENRMMLENDRFGRKEASSFTPNRPVIVVSELRRDPTSTFGSQNTDEIQDDQMDIDPSLDEAESQSLNQREEEMEIEINPNQSLFDNHVSSSVEANVLYMQQHFGFYVPDVESLVDLEGLVGYCQEKIRLGRTCLWCQRRFSSAAACQAHMRSKSHCKLLHETGVDAEDLDVFYDFSATNQDFLRHLQNDDEYDNDDDEDWEDVTDNEEEEEADGDEGGNARDMSSCDVDSNGDDDDDIYHGYEKEVQLMGLNVTELGELVFPDGRIVGHRSFRRYYQQRLASYHNRMRTDSHSTAVQAARIAAGERLYRGQVYNIYTSRETEAEAKRESSSTASHSMLSTALQNKRAVYAAGLQKGMGRSGQGLLVRSPSSLASFPCCNYTQLSIYRYRAAVRKARLGDQYGRRLWQKTNTNLNRMDKKANRIMNGVSVAHAAR